MSDYELVDTRNWYGTAEFPPAYEVIQLNSEKSDDFLVEGTTFYKVAGKNGVAVKFMPGWNGMYISIVSDGEKKEWNKKLLKKVQKWVQDNNFLKGEKFALSGEFIDKGEKTWDSLFADKKNISSVQKSLKVLEGKAKSRGLLFIGPPGTGKTLTGKVLMDNTESTFIWVSSKDMYRIGAVGALKLAFSLARDLGPSILFMEDIDTWIQREAVDMMKTELDGMQENKGMLTILTSNNPELLPDALLDRPGRFHEILNYDLPTKEVRSEMIHQWSGVEKEIADIYAEQTKGMSGAHIKELIEYAEMLSEDDSLEMCEALGKSLDKLMEQKELIGKIRQNTKGFDRISIKEGKVISKKNLEKIVSARDALNGVIDISDKVNDNETTEAEEKFLNNLEVIGKEIETQGMKGEELIIKTLQAIVKVSNKTLHESKKARN